MLTFSLVLHFACLKLLILNFSSIAGQISGLKLNWEQNGGISGKRSFLLALAHVMERHGMSPPVVKVCQYLIWLFFF